MTSVISSLLSVRSACSWVSMLGNETKNGSWRQGNGAST